MAGLSVVIICFNEEKNLERCLSSVRWAEEIVVLDSYSTDRTLEIAKQYTSRVYQHEWEGYSRQKSRALALATQPWILSLDADEAVSPGLAEEIRGCFEGETKFTGYRMPRMAYYLGRFLRHCWYPDYQLRLFRRDRGRWIGAEVHEKILLDGPVGTLRHPLLHYSFEGIGDHLETISRYTALGAESLRRSGRSFSLLRLLGSPLAMFLQNYVGKRGFLDGLPGFIASVLSGVHEFVKYARLYELERTASP